MGWVMVILCVPLFLWALSQGRHMRTPEQIAREKDELDAYLRDPDGWEPRGWKESQP